MTHTPGPWTATEEDSDGHFVIEASGPSVGDYAVAYTAGWYREDGRNDGPDNARLIAAAPDLLDAAKDALGFINLVAPKHPGDVDSLVEALRAAIDKATGVTA